VVIKVVCRSANLIVTMQRRSKWKVVYPGGVSLRQGIPITLMITATEIVLTIIIIVIVIMFFLIAASQLT
jgi:hypothetical protein